MSKRGKILIQIAVLAITMNVGAQDTMLYMSDGYLFYSKPTALSMNSIDCWPAGLPNSVLWYVFEDSIPVYGIAMTYRIWRGDKIIPYDSLLSEFHPTLFIPDDSLSLSKVNDSLFPMQKPCLKGVRPVNWVEHHDESSLRKKLVFKYEYDYPKKGEWNTACIEYYFNQPSWVIDTFYVGAYDSTLTTNDWWQFLGVFAKGIPSHQFRVLGPSAWGNGDIKLYCLGKESTEQNTLIGGVNKDIVDSGYVSWGGIFPIVGLRCTPVRNFQKVSQGKGYAWLGWRRFADEGTSYELRLWQYTVASGDTLVQWDTVVNTTDTAQLFEGLALGGSFMGRIRKNCRYATAGYDTTVHSQWSDPVYFQIDTYDWDGIDRAQPRMDFLLSPNPARDRVEIRLMQRQPDGGRIEVVDVHGRTLASHPLPPDVDLLTLDLTALPSGAYLLKLVTPQGIATRRLLKH